MQYRGEKYVIKTLQYRLKTSSKLTKYFDSMYSESHIWLNAGIEARRAGLSVFDTQKIAAKLRTIPQTWARGAIREGYKLENCRYVRYGRKTYPLFSDVPLGKKSKGNTVYFPKCNVQFKLQKGKLPSDSQLYKIVDVTNNADKERQFELHITIREHVPARVCTGVHAGIDMGGKHTLVVGKSDGTIAMLTLREKDTLRNIARIHKKISRCKLHSHRWRKLYDQLDSIYKKMGNRQTDKMRKFNKKLMKQCDRIIMEGMNLRTMTSKGKGQKTKNRITRQSRCGKARNDIAQKSLRYNVEYIEIDPKNTSKQCCMCCSMNTWREGSKFRCYNCGMACHADVNAAFNILFAFRIIRWSKRSQGVYELYNEAGMVSRGKIHLGTCTIPPGVNDVIAGTGGHQVRRQSHTDNERLLETPLDGNLPTFVALGESPSV